MELRDIVVTPILLIFVFIVSILVRPRITDEVTRNYFLPALWLKIFGALALGFIYQFYYNGGDTYNYHTHGSRIIWEALTSDFSKGIKLLFNRPGANPELFSYVSKIPFYHDPQSFFIVRITSVLDVFTFSSYTGTAILYALISFSGAWVFFITFYREFHHLHKQLALAILFIPSVIFWGSGILKDTITLAALGFLTYAIHQLFIGKKVKLLNILLLLLSVWVLYSVKKYILICFVPAALFWIYARQIFSMGSPMLRILLVPLLIVLSLGTGYYGIVKIGESDAKYSINNLAKTAQITAYDIRFWTGRDAGSGYTLGELDGTFSSMIKLAPKAVNVSLFRPYLWEVKNPLMLLSALESFFFLSFTLWLLLSKPIAFVKSFTDPNVLFCFVFSIVFAFGVGVSTFNFGTLARYKIPLLPFYFLGLILVANQIRHQQKEVKAENAQ